MTDTPPLLYHSQSGQDRWIEQLYSGLRGGYFVEAGAGDGVYLSNTLYLERELGWNGICIEPSRQYRQLARNRCCQTDPALLGGDEREVEFLESYHSAEFGDDHYQHLSGIAEHLKRYNPTGPRYRRMTEPLVHVLRARQTPKFIHYLSLDTEGSELMILAAFPFGEYNFGAITVEHNNDEQYRAQLYDLLTAHKYLRLASVEFDDWYVGPGMSSWVDHWTGATTP